MSHAYRKQKNQVVKQLFNYPAYKNQENTEGIHILVVCTKIHYLFLMSVNTVETFNYFSTIFTNFLLVYRLHNCSTVLFETDNMIYGIKIIGHNYYSYNSLSRIFFKRITEKST